MIKVAFLDRDGVINVDHGYVATPERFEFVAGIYDLCRCLQTAGYGLIVVTNQSGIARGYYTEQRFLRLNHWMHQQLTQQGIQLLDTFYCPHHPQATIPDYRQVCRCRKPQPGLFEQACQKYSIDLPHSIMIGDRLSDMAAAQAAGVGQRYWFNPAGLEIPPEITISAHVRNLEAVIEHIAPSTEANQISSSESLGKSS